jgi:translation initiation factor 4E
MALHVLQTPWTFYYHNRKTTKDWGTAIQKISKVSTVEEFWSVYSRIKRPAALKPQALESLHFFRGDSRAMWESPENANGGTFRYDFDVGHSSLAWERLLLGFIGEQLDADLIGAVVHRKRDIESIAVWNRTSDNPQLKIKLAEQLFKMFGVPFKKQIVWRKHQSDGKQPTSTYTFEGDGVILEK